MDSNINLDKCNSALDELTSLLENGDVNEQELVNLKMRFPDCISTIQEQLTLWKDLNEMTIPEVSSQLHSNFYTTLAELDSAHQNSNIPSESIPTDNVRTLWSTPWKWAVAASILAFGIIIGRGISNDQPQILAEESHSTISNITYANHAIQVSATEKLIALQEIKEVAHPSDKVIEALYQVLLNDHSINVRLTAIETLIHFADQPKARAYLIRAIPYQESALVQVALADAMLILQEKKSAEAWQSILNSPDVEPDVKLHITETLETLL